MQGDGSSSGSHGFYGRAEEIRLFQEAVCDPRGGAIVVVGQQGMGKTWLLDKFAEIARAMQDVRCGVVREEVTEAQHVDGVLDLLMRRGYEAGQIKEGSREPTPKRLEQWRALLNVINIGELVMSLRRDQAQNAREQFLAAMERIAGKMAADARAIFMIDPWECLQEKSDQDWSIVVKRLPDKVKFVFAQRPDDAIADSDVFAGLRNVVRIPGGGLDVLDEAGFDRMVSERAPETKMTAQELRKVLERYERHPYAVGAAIELLADGLPAEELPRSKEPTKFADAQWKRVQRLGEDAIRLFRAYAILEVPVPDEVVDGVSGLSSEKRLALLADKYLGGLLRDEGGVRRIYHAILSDHVRGEMRADEAKGYHERAIGVYRERLGRTPPDALAARRLAMHVREVEGDEAFVRCFVDECTAPLIQLGLLDDVMAITRDAMSTVQANSIEFAALAGNIGTVLRTRGDLDGAEAMHRKSLEINERLGSQEGMANQYGNIGTVLRTRGDLDGAEAMYRKSLQIEEHLGRLEGIASDYGNIGTVLLVRGALDGAEAMHRKSLEIEERLGRLEGMARQYGNLGIVMRVRGDLDGAEKMYLKSLEINERLGNQEGMAIQYGNLGVVMKTRGDHDGAEAMYLKSLEINERLGNQEGMASQYGNLGVVMKTRGDLDGAEGMYRKALEIQERLGLQEGMAAVYGNLGNVMRTRGDLDGAEAMHRKSLEINEGLGRLEGMANQYGNLGIVMAMRGDVVGARAMWEKARDLFQQLDAQHMVEKMDGWLRRLEGDRE